MYEVAQAALFVIYYKMEIMLMSIRRGKVESSPGQIHTGAPGKP